MTRRILTFGLVGGFLAALALLAAGCAKPQTLEHWPARDALYARYCALEVHAGNIPFADFDACLHRLKVHRGEPCTCRRPR